MQIPLKPLPVLLVAWAFAGFGAVVGSILGHSAGKPALFAGAVLGGILGIALAIAVVTRLHWLSLSDRGGAFMGAMNVSANSLVRIGTLVLGCAMKL